MTAQAIFNIFIFLLIMEQVFETVLSVINLNYAKNNAAKLPKELQGIYEDQEMKKSLDYSHAKTCFSIFSSFYSLIFLLIFLFSNTFLDIDLWLKAYGFRQLFHGTIYLLLIVAIFSLLGIPLSYYSTFIIEEKFGFNKSTRLQWVKDQLTSLILSFIITGPVIYFLLYIMQSFSGYWWLLAACFIAMVQIFLAFIFPVWIAPLFNKFTPLEESELKEEILKMVSSQGFLASGVYKVDGSRRSRHANAYFAGLGKSKRIVLYDTLINLLGVREMLAVLAHEIGHEKLGHIKKTLLFSTSLLFAGFYLMYFFSGNIEFYNAFGFKNTANYSALLIFSLLSGPLMFFVSPFFNMLSRRFEFQADKYACNAAGGSEPLTKALIALSKNSLSNINPHPLYSFIHYSHPALAERIKAMSNLETVLNSFSVK